ncbi:MAG: glycoside hydrolase family 25 [Clostridia bacterium]|nr:glycoside hydrolase family 25 [Clostridia bacterium]
MDTKSKSKKRRTIIATVIIALVIALAIPAILLYCGVIHLNNPSSEKYPVRGVDLSSYQGTVDWDTLASQGISFAFIKATEGSKHIDPYFEKNWDNASKTGLRIGAYHFFSFESSGEKQAELFCGNVKPVDRMLPPVIDVEFYGSFKSEKDIDAAQIKQELRVLVDKLTETYGMKPVIYASKDTYSAIVKNDFGDCDLWYRSVYSAVPDGVDWTFWQYSNRHRLKGYDGKEKYIDMNVFCGSPEEFEAYRG